MGVYRRMSGPHKDPKDLFVSVKEDGDKAVMYTPSGVKVFHRKEIEEVEFKFNIYNANTYNTIELTDPYTIKVK